MTDRCVEVACMVYKCEGVTAYLCVLLCPAHEECIKVLISSNGGAVCARMFLQGTMPTLRSACRPGHMTVFIF